jgi:hypothetical protein
VEILREFSPVSHISQVGLRTLDGEEGIVLSPYDQRLRLFIAKEFMPVVIEGQIRLVVMKKVQLDGVIAGTIEEELVESERSPDCSSTIVGEAFDPASR